VEGVASERATASRSVPRQPPARPEPRHDDVRGDFEQGIGEAEGAQHQPGLGLVQMQVGRDRHDRLADRNALDVHDHG